VNIRQRQSLQDYLNRDKSAQEREEAQFIAGACCVLAAVIAAIIYWR